MDIKFLSTKQAAARLGVSTRRVCALCKQGRLGWRVGREWVIPEVQLARFAAIPRKAGRPQRAKP